MLVINEAKIVSAHNLLGEMENKELVYTTRGILNHIMNQTRCSENTAARLWMGSDYSLVRAAVNAAVLLLEAGIKEEGDTDKAASR